MEFGRFVELFSRSWQMDDRGQRFGQFMFNSVYEMRPEIADALRSTKLDPFYDDRKVGDFLVEVGLRW